MSTCEKENLDRTNESINQHNQQQMSSGKNLSKSKRPAQTLYVPKHQRAEEKKSLNTNACIQNSLPMPRVVAAVSNSLDPIGSDGFSHSPINDPSIIGYITSPKTSPTNKIQQMEQTEEEPSILDKLASLSISSNTQPIVTTRSNSDIIKSEPEIPTNGSSNFIKCIQFVYLNGFQWTFLFCIDTLLKKRSADLPTAGGDWFDLYDDSGQSTAPGSYKDGKLKSQSRQEEATKVIDYSKFEVQAPDLDEEEYGHILEIYDFPVEFKNENIFGALKEVIGNLDCDFLSILILSQKILCTIFEYLFCQLLKEKNNMN